MSDDYSDYLDRQAKLQQIAQYARGETPKKVDPGFSPTPDQDQMDQLRQQMLTTHAAHNGLTPEDMQHFQKLRQLIMSGQTPFAEQQAKPPVPTDSDDDQNP